MYKARGTECGQAFLQKSWVIYAKRFAGNGYQWVKDVEGHENRPLGNGYDSYDSYDS